MIAIFLLSHTPGQTIQDAGFGSETLHVNVHFLLFFLLTFLYYKATKGILLSVALCVAYSILDEVHQSYVPMRSSSLYDVGVDFLGSILAGGILWKLQYMLPKSWKIWLNS